MISNDFLLASKLTRFKGQSDFNPDDPELKMALLAGFTSALLTCLVLLGDHTAAGKVLTVTSENFSDLSNGEWMVELSVLHVH